MHPYATHSQSISPRPTSPRTAIRDLHVRKPIRALAHGERRGCDASAGRLRRRCAGHAPRLGTRCRIWRGLASLPHYQSRSRGVRKAHRPCRLYGAHCAGSHFAWRPALARAHGCPSVDVAGRAGDPMRVAVARHLGPRAVETGRDLHVRHHPAHARHRRSGRTDQRGPALRRKTADLRLGRRRPRLDVRPLPAFA